MCSTPSIYIKCSSKYKSYYYLFFFLHNFNLKAEVIIDQKSLLVTELNKFGVIGLLHFHKGILQSHMTEFPFQKFEYVLF